MITFTYSISDFISNIQVLSLYRGNSSLDKGPESILDDTAISSEDDALLKKYLKYGASLIAHTLSGYAKDLINSSGETVLMEGEPFEVSSTQVIFRINMPETFQVNVINQIDEAIKDALENYVLYRVAKQKLIEGETYFNDWEQSRGQIRSYLVARTKPTRRTYRFY